MSLYGNTDKVQSAGIARLKEEMKSKLETIAIKTEMLDVQAEVMEQVVQLRVLSNGGAFVPPKVDLMIPGSIWNDGGVIKISAAV